LLLPTEDKEHTLTLLVTGSEKRGQFTQILNFGFKTLITLKLWWLQTWNLLWKFLLHLATLA